MLVDTILEISLILIMFTIGLSLNIKDFKKIIKKPKKVYIGLISQIILLPLLAFIILQFSNLPVEFKIGVLILASCPGGSTSNFVSYLLKLDVPLSISLTSANTIITLFSIPLLVNFFISFYQKSVPGVSLPFLDVFFNLLFIILLPVALGIFVNEKRPKVASKFEKYLKIIGIVALAFTFGMKFFASELSGGSGISLESALHILPFLLLFHLLALLMGWGIFKLSEKNDKTSITGGIEIGLQNTALALLITGTLLKNNLMTQPILVYAIFSFFTTFLFGFIMKKIFFKKIEKQKF